MEKITAQQHICAVVFEVDLRPKPPAGNQPLSRQGDTSNLKSKQTGRQIYVYRVSSGTGFFLFFLFGIFPADASLAADQPCVSRSVEALTAVRYNCTVCPLAPRGPPAFSIIKPFKSFSFRAALGLARQQQSRRGEKAERRSRCYSVSRVLKQLCLCLLSLSQLEC